MNTGPTDGYPTLVASFHLTASQYLGSVIYTVDRDLLTLGSEQWKRVFIINDQGKEVDKKTLLRVDTEEKKRAFADFIL